VRVGGSRLRLDKFGLVFVEFGPKVRKGDCDGSVSDLEGAAGGLLKAAGGGTPGATCPGVDGAEVCGAEAGVIVQLGVREAEESSGADARHEGHVRGRAATDTGWCNPIE